MCFLCLAAQGPGEASAPSRFLADSPLGSPLGAAPRLHLTTSGDARVDGLLSGFAWSSVGTVTFSFPDSAADYESFYGASEPTRGFAQAGSALRDAVRKILLGEAAGITSGPGSPGASVLGFTNLAIAEGANDAWSDIRVALSAAPSTAWAYYPNGREGGDVWFGSRHDFANPRLGTWLFVTAIHELGHALGLKHPHETSNGFAALPEAWDSLEFTVMSYRSRVGAPANLGYTNGSFDYPQSWMMLDIAALQAMYGADYTHRAGNTRYSWDPNTGETFIDGIGQGRPGEGSVGQTNRIFLTIWDGGGTDTYDLSNYANGVLVDLAPGAHSVLSASQLAVLDVRDGTQARGNVFNSLLYQGNTASLIENAIGGAGADTLLGNVGANRLEGGAGQDRLEGREGPDLLIGGAGADTLIGGTGHDVFLIQDTLDTIIELPGEGIDTLLVETASAATLPDGVEILRLGSAGRIATGNAAGNLLIGGAGNDCLDGRGGADVIIGGPGADTLTGGLGADRFVMRPGDGVDRITDFTPGLDQLALLGFGLDAATVLARLTPVLGGLSLDLGLGAGVFLAGVAPGSITAGDLILA
jgi:serralysin